MTSSRTRAKGLESGHPFFLLSFFFLQFRIRNGAKFLSFKFQIKLKGRLNIHMIQNPKITKVAP